MRHLLELAVEEVSLTSFPANPAALVTLVKSVSGDPPGEDEARFLALLREIQDALPSPTAREEASILQLLRDMQRELTLRTQEAD